MSTQAPQPLTVRLVGPRIVLRPLEDKDTKRLQQYANDHFIACNTTVPYPYTLSHARSFIQHTHYQLQNRDALPLAVCLRENDAFCGMCSLVTIRWSEWEAELGYWMGRPFRRRGYTYEAVRLMVRYAFESLRLHRIYAGVLPQNTISARLLQKAGFRYRGPMQRPGLPDILLDCYEILK